MINCGAEEVHDKYPESIFSGPLVVSSSQTTGSIVPTSWNQKKEWIDEETCPHLWHTQTIHQSLMSREVSPIAKLKLIDGPPPPPPTPVFLLFLESGSRAASRRPLVQSESLCGFSPHWPQPRGKADKSIRINGARLKLLHDFYGNSSSASLFASGSHYAPPQEEEFLKNTLINH